MMTTEELVLPLGPSASGRCGLCWERFVIGDEYVQVWRRRGAVPRVALTLHRGCYGELDDGDLARIFGELERHVERPLAFTRGKDPA